MTVQKCWFVNNSFNSFFSESPCTFYIRFSIVLFRHCTQSRSIPFTAFKHELQVQVAIISRNSNINSSECEVSFPTVNDTALIIIATPFLCFH